MQNNQSAKPLSVSKLRSYGRGGLDRIAKRRYTRDLFDDIVATHNGGGSSSSSRSAAAVEGATGTAAAAAKSGGRNHDCSSEITEEERLITLLRCFNNFFNKKFDSDRLFNALNFVLTKERTRAISSWLHQKKADNIYVIGRFILQLASFMETTTKLEPGEYKTIETFLNLVLVHSDNVLDENLILILSFLSRKGFFRSIMGFLMKHFGSVFQGNVAEIICEGSTHPVKVWLYFLEFPMKFAVVWRIKVEEWLKREMEKREIYGSTDSLDEEYTSASVALMSQSIISVSSEYSSEDPGSRQTRIFLRRLLSAWCNSVYFNDLFFQYHLSLVHIRLANHLLVTAVPIYLIILGLVEPSRARVQSIRKSSIDSLSGCTNQSSFPANLAVQFRLNVAPSAGVINLFAKYVCGRQQLCEWRDVGQEEAYGIIVFFYLAIFGLTEDTEENRSSYFNDVDTLMKESQQCLSESIVEVLEIAFSGPLDPDVVLPVAYLFQSLQTMFPIGQYELFRGQLLLSGKVQFLRHLWSLLSQSVANACWCRSQLTDKSSNGNGSASAVARSDQARTSSRLSSCDVNANTNASMAISLPEDQFLMTQLAAGIAPCTHETARFLNVAVSLLQGLNVHLNTLYVGEIHQQPMSLQRTPSRKRYSQFFPSNQNASGAADLFQQQQQNINKHNLQWSDLSQMATELASLSVGLISLACCDDDSTKASALPLEQLQQILDLTRTFHLHISKLNMDSSFIVWTNSKCCKQDKYKLLTVPNNTSQILEILRDVVNNLSAISTFPGNRDLLEVVISVRQLPQLLSLDERKTVLDNLLAAARRDLVDRCKGSGNKTAAAIDCEKQSIFKAVFLNLNDVHDLIETDSSRESLILEGQPISVADLVNHAIHDGLDSSTNHLFSCEATQLLYPNPYVEGFYEDFPDYYECLGRLFAVNILNGRGITKKFTLFFLEKLLYPDQAIFNINDLKPVDMEVAKNLMLLAKAEDGLDCFNFKFILTQNSFGKSHRHDIVPNGENIPVTNDNKMEYIYKVVQFILDKQISNQTTSFRKGMESVFPIELLSLLTSDELQHMLFTSP